MAISTPIFDFPSSGPTDFNALYQGLGSFWTVLFEEKQTVKGYTMASAEELIQTYMNLIEVVNSYSVKDIPVFHTEKWLPIVITKSQFNQAPFIFEPNGAVFGPQSPDDLFYANLVFRFGFPKTPNAGIYAVTPAEALSNFSLIANRVINPSSVYLNGVDVTLKNGVLYFNKNVFDDPNVQRTELISDTGAPVTFIDSNGDVQNDEMIVLWAYNAEVDTKNVYNNFGYIFELNIASSDNYKDIIKSIFNIFVEGPTVAAVRTVIAAFSGLTPIQESEETVELVRQDASNYIVATDKHVYRYPLSFSLRSSVIAGAKFSAGDVLVTAIDYFDSVVQPNWWTTQLQVPKLGLAPYIFLGNYQYQLYFKNDIELVTLSESDVLNFPVEGHPDDVQIFQDYINQTVNKIALKADLGLFIDQDNPANSRTSVVINPIDFVFKNFFSNNMALLKINLPDVESVSNFLQFVPFISAYLPKHVFLLFIINLNMPVEVYNKLNNCWVSPDFPDLTLNSDGSLPDGSRPEVPVSDPDYYKNLNERLFSISMSPNSGTFPFFNAANQDNLETFKANGTDRTSKQEFYTGSDQAIITGTTLSSPHTFDSTYVGLNVHVVGRGKAVVSSVSAGNLILNRALGDGSNLDFYVYTNSQVVDGKVFTYVPAAVITNGKQTYPTTEHVGNLLLIDFS